jgi:hypothetical protein
MEAGREKGAEDNDHFEDEDLGADAHPSLAERARQDAHAHTLQAERQTGIRRRLYL